MKTYCLKCFEELDEDLFKSCSNRKCLRYALVTTRFIPEEKLSEVKELLKEREQILNPQN